MSYVNENKKGSTFISAVNSKLNLVVCSIRFTTIIDSDESGLESPFFQFWNLTDEFEQEW